MRLKFLGYVGVTVALKVTVTVFEWAGNFYCSGNIQVINVLGFGTMPNVV